MYEFSADENKVFTRLVAELRGTGIGIAAASVMLLAYHLVSYFGVSAGLDGGAWMVYLDYALWGLISLIGIVVAVLLIKATRAFEALIHTEGDDLAHLMKGIADLTSILRLIQGAGWSAMLLLGCSGALLVMYG